jgi:hypothetical protein
MSTNGVIPKIAIASSLQVGSGIYEFLGKFLV